ncbi:cation transporter [Allosphingosinicella sp.]|jgi:cation diffusion facilitator family transporter|uniref:cation transporter n=1 Tax=Allosphingosinicella sp. TaxID=2823234 RepID=UPI002F13CC3B
MNHRIPEQIEADLAKARRLAWWTIAWMTSIVIVMWLVMGASQAMKTAFVEDLLSMIPAVVLLIALRFERREPTRRYSYGFYRVHSLAFLISAVALAAVGGLLLFEAVTTLIAAEHVTVPPVMILGEQVWLGWLMIGALLYSVVPPFILGRMKLPVAERLHDEVLHTDAMMQKADWMTGLAGTAGVIGLGFGLWWADAAAAGLIALSILHDGIVALRIAGAELVDGTPRALGSAETAEDAAALIDELERRYPGAAVRLRESGRYLLAEVEGASGEETVDLAEIWPGPPDRSWRLAKLSFVPPGQDRS